MAYQYHARGSLPESAGGFRGAAACDAPFSGINTQFEVFEFLVAGQPETSGAGLSVTSEQRDARQSARICVTSSLFSLRRLPDG